MGRCEASTSVVKWSEV